MNDRRHGRADGVCEFRNRGECVRATQEPMELRVERVPYIPSAALSVLSPYAHILHDFVILSHKDVIAS